MGSTVAVFGCGAVGLNVLQGALLQSPSCVIVVDRDPAKLVLARRFGAHLTIDATSLDPVEEIRRATRGRGSDHVYEAAGAPATLRQAVESARPGGDVVLLGKLPLDEEVTFRWGSLMGEKRIVRSSYGGARPRHDFPTLATLYLEGRLHLDELITHRLRLDDVNDGFDAMRAGEVLRAVIEFD
jgi:S-(hydroxymethyl)glutathione dehydrogenase/alcohol dehydrogenase